MPIEQTPDGKWIQSDDETVSCCENCKYIVEDFSEHGGICRRTDRYTHNSGYCLKFEPRTASDPVNHPSHYTDGTIEVIDFIEDKQLPFHLGNAVKYICRAGKKDPSKEVEDLRKAVWYINRYIGMKGGSE